MQQGRGINVGDVAAALAALRTGAGPGHIQVALGLRSLCRSQAEREFLQRVLAQFELRVNLEARVEVARREIPTAVLREETPEARIKALLQWFKHVYMKPFVSTLACDQCGSATAAAGRAVSGFSISLNYPCLHRKCGPHSSGGLGHGRHRGNAPLHDMWPSHALSPLQRCGVHHANAAGSLR